MTFIHPIRLFDNLLLGLHERADGAHSVLLRGAAADAGEGDDAVVDDDADLVAFEGGAG